MTLFTTTEEEMFKGAPEENPADDKIIKQDTGNALG